MPATPQQIKFEEKDFQERASYDDLEPGEYLAVCTDVEDAQASTGNVGWKFIFDVKGLPLNMTVWLRGGGKWKVREVFNALGYPLSPADDLSMLDPNALIGGQCVAKVVKVPRDPANPEEGVWTNIDRVVPYVAEPVAQL
jgi:hypothetical protein